MTSFVLHFLLVSMAGFINRSQQDVIEYLREENLKNRRPIATAMDLFAAGKALAGFSTSINAT